MEWTQGQRASIEAHAAPDGYMWVCAACGKLSKERTGSDPDASYGWDASCFLNAVLVKEGDYELGADGRVCKLTKVAYDPYRKPREGFDDESS